MSPTILTLPARIPLVDLLFRRRNSGHRPPPFGHGDGAALLPHFIEQSQAFGFEFRGAYQPVLHAIGIPDLVI